VPDGQVVAIACAVVGDGASALWRSARIAHSETSRGGYEHRARLAQRYGKVPAGKRLTISIVSRDEVELGLVDAPGNTGGRSELVPITVPGKVARYHETARQFRDRSERHEVSRATRLVHAIAKEAAAWLVGSSLPRVQERLRAVELDWHQG
jgi:hypothetical protein